MATSDLNDADLVAAIRGVLPHHAGGGAIGVLAEMVLRLHDRTLALGAIVTPPVPDEPDARPSPEEFATLQQRVAAVEVKVEVVEQKVEKTGIVERVEPAF